MLYQETKLNTEKLVKTLEHDYIYNPKKMEAVCETNWVSLNMFEKKNSESTE